MIYSDDLATFEKICRSQPGHLLSIACSVATAIEGQRCWSNPLLDSIAIRINLEDEIRQIAGIGRSIQDAEKALGDKSSGRLAKNGEVMEIYERRHGAIDDRVDLLLERVQALKQYWET